MAQYPSFSTGNIQNENNESDATTEKPQDTGSSDRISRRAFLTVAGILTAGAAGVSYTCSNEMNEEAEKYAKYAKGNKKKALEYLKLARNEQEDIRKQEQYMELMRAELRLYRTNMAYASKPHLYPVQQTLPDMNTLSDRELLEGTGISLD